MSHVGSLKSQLLPLPYYAIDLTADGRLLRDHEPTNGLTIAESSTNSSKVTFLVATIKSARLEELEPRFGAALRRLAATDAGTQRREIEMKERYSRIAKTRSEFQLPGSDELASLQRRSQAAKLQAAQLTEARAPLPAALKLNPKNVIEIRARYIPNIEAMINSVPQSIAARAARAAAASSNLIEQRSAFLRTQSDSISSVNAAAAARLGESANGSERVDLRGLVELDDSVSSSDDSYDEDRHFHHDEGSGAEADTADSDSIDDDDEAMDAYEHVPSTGFSGADEEV